MKIGSVVIHKHAGLQHKIHMLTSVHRALNIHFCVLMYKEYCMGKQILVNIPFITNC